MIRSGYGHGVRWRPPASADKALRVCTLNLMKAILSKYKVWPPPLMKRSGHGSYDWVPASCWRRSPIGGCKPRSCSLEHMASLIRVRICSSSLQLYGSPATDPLHIKSAACKNNFYFAVCLEEPKLIMYRLALLSILLVFSIPSLDAQGEQYYTGKFTSRLLVDLY